MECLENRTRSLLGCLHAISLAPVLWLWPQQQMVHSSKRLLACILTALNYDPRLRPQDSSQEPFVCPTVVPVKLEQSWADENQQVSTMDSV